MLSFWLGCYYGAVLGLIIGISYRHWESLYEPRTFIHEEPFDDIEKLPTIWRRDGGP